MKVIKLHLLVNPQAQQRPRVRTIGKHAQAYIPAESRNAKAMIALECRHQLEGIEPFHKPIALAMNVIFYRSPPQKLPKGITLPSTRPDLPNYLMLICDALQGYAYDDDSQLTTIKTQKRYGQPCIEVEIKEDIAGPG